MGLRDYVWQGCAGNWPPLFLRENYLFLGYTAWQGFCQQGRGVVICEVSLDQVAAVDWDRTAVDYSVRFITQAETQASLQSLNLQTSLIEVVASTAATYDPQQAMVLLLRGDGQTTLSLLQNMAASPPECYRQVRDRWAEFALTSDPHLFNPSSS